MGAAFTIRYRGGKSGIWVVLIVALCSFLYWSGYTITYAITETYELKGGWAATLDAIGFLVGFGTSFGVASGTLWSKTEHDAE